MPNRLIDLFGSYDLFGKSVPGALLTVGILSLFPKERLSFSGDLSLLGLVSAAVLLLFVGLMIGQGVHTLADNIEKAFLWFAIRARNWLTFLRSIGPDISISWVKISFSEESSLWRRFAGNGWNNFTDWISRRYWGTYDSLVGHRYLLGRSIQWNFAGEWKDERWELKSKGELYEHFAQAYQNTYGEDLRKKTPRQMRTQYPLITGQLAKQGVTQYRTFQSIYSFCRSMWVVFLILTLLYSFLIFGPTVFEWIPYFGGIQIGLFPLPYTAAGVEFLPNVIEPYVPYSLLIGTIVFFDAAGTYKRHYVEYIIADFAIHCRKRSKSESDEQDRESTLHSSQRIQPDSAKRHPHEDW